MGHYLGVSLGHYNRNGTQEKTLSLGSTQELVLEISYWCNGHEKTMERVIQI